MFSAPSLRTRLRTVAAWLARRGPRLLIGAAFVAVALMYACNRDMGGDARSPRGDGQYRPVLARGDGHLMFLMARSLAFDGDLRVDNDLARFGDPFGPPGGRAERATIPHPIGPPLLWTPLLWLAQAGAVIANLFGAKIQLHGYTLWHQRLVFTSSVVAALLAIVLGVRLARAVVGGRWGPAYAGVAILLGTSLTYYATFMPSYSHALDAAGAGGFLTAWALTLGRWDRRRVVLVGGLLGVAALMRTQELALGVVVVLEVATALVRVPHDEPAPWRWRGRVVGAAAAMLGVTLLVLIPQALAWHDMFGTFTHLPQGPNFTRPRYPMVAELLFASRNGWFSTHPLAYAGALGLVVLIWRGPRLAPHARQIGVGLLAALVVQVYLNSIILDWWAQASFGQRRLCSMTVPLVVGLAAWLELGASLVARWGRPLARGLGHGVAVVGLGWFVAWNLSLVWPYRAGRAPVIGAGPSCCGGVRGTLRAIATPIYRRIGNPFAFPANAAFAWRHGVPLQRWDELVGVYPWLPEMTYTRASLRGQSVVWRVGSPGQDRFVERGFAPGRPIDGGLRWTTAATATILVPNLVPLPLTLTLRLEPNLAAGQVVQPVLVRWNGAVVVEQRLDGPATVTWSIEGDVGINRLTVEAPVAPPSDQARARGASAPTGVAIGDLRFTGA
ncbi:MAG: hypothetical protein R3B06_08925 [Kofleriaceae bacterium]